MAGLTLTNVQDKLPIDGGWYIVQALKGGSGYMIAKYVGADEYTWIEQGTGQQYKADVYCWYWDNLLINVGSDNS